MSMSFRVFTEHSASMNAHSRAYVHEYYVNAQASLHTKHVCRIMTACLHTLLLITNMSLSRRQN